MASPGMSSEQTKTAATSRLARGIIDPPDATAGSGNVIVTLHLRRRVSSPVSADYCSERPTFSDHRRSLPIQRLQTASRPLNSGLSVGIEHQLYMTDAHVGVAGQVRGEFFGITGPEAGLFFTRPAGCRWQIDQETDGARNRGGISASLLEGGVDFGTVLGQLCQRLSRPGVPDVAIGGEQAQHPRRGRPDQDRRSLGSGATRAQLTVSGLVVGAGEIDLPVAQQAVDDGDGLGEAADPVIEGVAEGGVPRLIPPRTEAENEPPPTDLVGGVGDFGKGGGGAEGGAADQRSKPHPP